MKRFLLRLGIVSLVLLLCLGFAYFYIEKRVTRFDLPKGELKWSKVRPQNARMCVPAAFTGTNGIITGINEICTENVSEDIFDMFGRKLKEMPRRGLVIKNNKKIYIK